MADIQNTKEVVTLIAALTKSIVAAQENDGKIDLNDLTHFLSVVPAIGPAFGDISEVPEELADLDTEELKEITQAVQAVIGDLKLESKYVEVADHAVAAGFAIYNIVQILREKDEDPTTEVAAPVV